ncbi:MAG: methyl-accepting chemotaxis protein [Magnetospirillum sp.]|nr:methyl-accepting chemotaxis protein [Magnetospirillum sp.]
MIDQLLQLTGSVTGIANDKINRINGITRRSRMLALNASIEAHRVGTAGRGFAVVADEVKVISGEIAELTGSLQGELRDRLEQLSDFGRAMASQVRQVRGERLADLAHNTVEIADRNLYERSCDVRWWATDPAVVDCAAAPASAERRAYASARLGVILDSYTVYRDLWVADASGRVVANGRPDHYPHAAGADVSGEEWFRRAMATRDGGDFAVTDITRNPRLGHALAATYATAIREGGKADGPAIGALGIFFDWEPQAQAIVGNVRLSPEEKARSRCLLIDSRHRVIAASDQAGVLTETFPLNTEQGERGFYADPQGHLVGYGLTPGYETYRGLGWYGVIVQKD